MPSTINLNEALDQGMIHICNMHKPYFFVLGIKTDSYIEFSLMYSSSSYAAHYQPDILLVLTTDNDAVLVFVQFTTKVITSLIKSFCFIFLSHYKHVINNPTK